MAFNLAVQRVALMAARAVVRAHVATQGVYEFEAATAMAQAVLAVLAMQVVTSLPLRSCPPP